MSLHYTAPHWPWETREDHELAKTLVGKTLVRNVRGVGAMRKLGAKVVDESVRNGHPEYIWTLER